MVSKKYQITGLDCMECALGLESSINSLTTVEEAILNFLDGTLTVRGAIDDDELRKVVAKLGYGLADGDLPQKTFGSNANVFIHFWHYLLQRRGMSLVLMGGGAVIFSFFLSWIGLPLWVSTTIQITALVVAGLPIAHNGLVNLWLNHTFNINLLMTIAGVGAVVIGEVVEAASLIILFNLAETLEGFTNERARDALSQLTALSPTHAIRILEGEEEPIPVEKLGIGDRILIRPGDRVPLDGVITEGQSGINQAPITGESLPVWKAPGDEVYSGTVNGDGQLIVEVTRLVSDSTLQRIIEMVMEAQSRRSRSQKFIEKFAQYYTPAMVIIAILMAAVPPLFFGEPFLNALNGDRGWLHRALVLLVISCPCALVISTPVTMAASIARAVREGVLFKGGVFVETLSKVRVFAFDKTGTLTHGEPQVVACRDLASNGDSSDDACDDMLALAYALERHSTHPLARAIREETKRRGVTEYYPPAANLTTRGGLGLEGIINGRLMTIGSLRLFEEEHDIPSEVHAWVEKAESKGNTAMLLCDGERVRGYIAVADTPRTDTQDVISSLRDLNKYTVMLTGDNERVARAMGEIVGLDDVRAGLLPGDKQDAIAELRERYGDVAMVGDGINDTPALAAADLGIAMGGKGSAQVMETADVVLMADDIKKLPFAIRLSRFAIRLIGQNIIFSLGTKLLVAAIALLGVAPLWLAVLADIGVSLLVTLNGMRALRFNV